ncbi:hypothetical protein Tco_0319802 [Tanacetum coccineum]
MLDEEWYDIQAKIDVDYQLAERLQAREQEELSNTEKATLFQQLLEKRRKHFAAKRAEEKRNKPLIKAQQKKMMCTYLKNMEGYKLNDLKLKDFDSIQEMFDKAFKRVNTFEDFRTELVEGKQKRAGEELMQENVKNQKGDLKTMFGHHVEDIVWRKQDYKVLDWKLYDSCGVHSLRMQHVHIHMLFVYSNRGRLLGSVVESFSLSEDLNIKSSKCYAKVSSAPAHRVLKQHLQFSLGCETETDEGLTKSFTFTTNESSSSSPSESEEIDLAQTEAVLGE